MSENTKIEWADHTFNPWIGCTAISPAGCANCYAKKWVERFGGDFSVRRRTKTWGDPVRWNKQHAAFFAEHGLRQRVFCASLADVFDNEVDPLWRADLFRLIEQTPNLDWLLLTKRIGNARTMMADAIATNNAKAEWVMPLANVWLGATIVNQEEADRDIPKLLATPARVRFLSMEPLLGPVDLHLRLTTVEERLRVQREISRAPGELQRLRSRGELLDWVIAGGESGAYARPMHPDWPRSLRDQCQAADVPFMFKQWGHHLPVETDVTDGDGYICWAIDGCGELLECRHKIVDAHGHTFAPVGKKAAGRLLDGRTWDEVPA